MRVLTGILTAVAVVAIVDAARRVHTNRQGKIVSPHWPHPWIERVDNVMARCTEELARNSDVRRDIAGGPPTTPPPELESLLSTHAGDVVAWLQGCAALNLYPHESWPPTVDEVGEARDVVWRKLGLVAEQALGLTRMEA